MPGVILVSLSPSLSDAGDAGDAGEGITRDDIFPIKSPTDRFPSNLGPVIRLGVNVTRAPYCFESDLGYVRTRATVSSSDCL